MGLASIGVALAVAVAGAGPAIASGAASSWHEDESYGYKIKPPKKWTEIPIRSGEDWLIAKYLSDRVYYWTDDDQGWTWEHQPEMMVVAFISEELREQLADAHEDDDDDVEIKTEPYDDYEDYLDRTYTGGGFYVDEKEETERRGLKVTQYSIKVEKLARNGPKRIITWIYHTEGIDLAVQFEVLEDEYDKLERTIERSLKSFKPIERTLSSLSGAASTLPYYVSVRSMDEGTPDERKAKRLQSQELLHDQAITGLAEGWSYEYMGKFLVLNHADDKYAERMAEHGGMVFEWLDESFPFVGPDEYVRILILRICADYDEKSSFARGRKAGGGWSWFGAGLEIVTHKDTRGFETGYEIEHLNTWLLSHWFQERDRRLYWAMPYWLRVGLRECIEEARADRRELEFRQDSSERRWLRELVREEKARSPRELVMTTSADFEDGGSSFDTRNEGYAFVRYLLSPAGRRSRTTKTLLKDYIAALDEVLDEMEAEEEEDGEKLDAPETEEEEEAYYKELSQRWKKREKEIVERTFQRVFDSWDEGDWRRLERAYFREL